MKLLLIISSLFLLVSCTQYRYDVTYEKCNGQTGSVLFNSKPVLTSKNNIGGYPPHAITTGEVGSIVTDICSFSYTREEIQ